MVYHLMDNLDQAIVKYHEALSVDPINPHIMELLNLALDSSSSRGLWISDAQFLNAVEEARTKWGFGHRGDRGMADVPEDVIV